MRLIDADTLPIWGFTQTWEEGIGIARCCEAVNNAPTVNAVPVVRCKDCKYADAYFQCDCGIGRWTKADDFCSYGERKE